MDIIGEDAMMILLYVIVGFVILMVLGLLVSNRSKSNRAENNQGDPGAGFIVESEEIIEEPLEEVTEKEEELT